MTPDDAPGLAVAAAWWAERRPDAPAVSEGGRTWSWRELDAWTAAIAARIAAIERGQDRAAGPARIAAEPPVSAAGVAMIHAAARSGAQVVLVPPRWSSTEQRALLADVEPWLLLVARDGDPANPSPPGRERTLPVIDVRGSLSPGGPMAGPPLAGAELVVPTSGTTARPRLARLTLRAVDASATAWCAVLPPATGWALSLGLAHVAGIGIVARAAAAGVPVLVPPDDAAPLEWLSDPRVSHASLVATQLRRLVDGAPADRPPGHLRCLLLGGGPIPESLLRRALAAGWPVWPSYGQTETASGVVAAEPSVARVAPDRAGTALPGVELRIGTAHPETNRPATGELEVRGPMVFSGYLGDAAATATRLTPDGWLRTGDLVDLDVDGRVHVIDRLDDVIISGGENVAPAEVEAALEVLPGVAEAAAVGVSDPEWGEVPVAIVVPQQGHDPDDAALLRGSAATLARFRRPRRVLRCAALPRGGGGKLLRRDLRGPAGEAIPIPTAPAERGPELETRVVLASDGQPLAVWAASRATAGERPALLLLHATLSSSAQLLRLAAELAPEARVILMDRRGSGGSRMAGPAPVDIDRHARDAAEVLAACGERSAIVVGHSFGGVVGLELAARRPGVVQALVAWEPPYLPLAPEGDRELLVGVAAVVRRAHDRHGPGGAARAFMERVAPGTWERLRPAQQQALEAEGDGVIADAAMPGLGPDGLAAIRAPVVLGTGAASEPFYGPIASAVATRIPGATVRSIAGLRHAAPILTPVPVADLVRDLLRPSPRPLEPSQESAP